MSIFAARLLIAVLFVLLSLLCAHRIVYPRPYDSLTVLGFLAVLCSTIAGMLIGYLL